MAHKQAYGLHPLGPSGIQMDCSKAMAILGFSPSQTFESTSTTELNNAFMKKLHDLLKPLPKIKDEIKLKKAEDNRRFEMRRINEALQFLIKKRTKSKHIEGWKLGQQKTFNINLALQALDDQTRKLRDDSFKIEQAKSLRERQLESERVQKMADEIATNLEGLSEGNSRSNRSLKSHYTIQTFAYS